MTLEKNKTMVKAYYEHSDESETGIYMGMAVIKDEPSALILVKKEKRPGRIKVFPITSLEIPLTEEEQTSLV